MAATPISAPEEHHTSTTITTPVSQEFPILSIEGQNESTSAGQPGLLVRGSAHEIALESRIPERGNARGRGIQRRCRGRPVPERSNARGTIIQRRCRGRLGPSFEGTHAFTSPGQNTPGHLAGPLFGGTHTFTSLGQNTPTHLAGPSFEQSNGFRPIGNTTPRGISGSSSGKRRGSTPFEETGPHDPLGPSF